MSDFRLFDGSNAEYHANTTFAGSTVLNDFRKHPKLFHEWEQGLSRPKDLDDPKAKGLRLGTALDALVSGTFDQEVYVLEKMDRRTKDGKAAWAQAQQDSRGLMRLPAAEFQMAQRMFDSVLKTPAARELLESDGVEQFGAMWKDAATGQGLKCKWDRLLKDGVVVELKTRRPTEGLHRTDPARDWLYMARSRGYLLQAALYVDGARRALEMPVQHVFLTVCNEPPYEVFIFDTDNSLIAEGNDLLFSTLNDIKACRDTGIWEKRGWNRRLKLKDGRPF